MKHSTTGFRPVTAIAACGLAALAVAATLVVMPSASLDRSLEQLEQKWASAAETAPNVTSGDPSGALAPVVHSQIHTDIELYDIASARWLPQNVPAQQTWPQQTWPQQTWPQQTWPQQTWNVPVIGTLAVGRPVTLTGSDGTARELVVHDVQPIAAKLIPTAVGENPAQFLLVTLRGKVAGTTAQGATETLRMIVASEPHPDHATPALQRPANRAL